MPEDQLTAQRYQAETCDYPVRDRGGTLRAVLYSTFALATLFASFRCLSRMPRLGGTGFSWDDLVLLTAYCMAVVMVGATELQVQNGSGRDEYTLTLKQITTYTYVSAFFPSCYLRVVRMFADYTVMDSGHISMRLCTILSSF